MPADSIQFDINTLWLIYFISQRFFFFTFLWVFLMLTLAQKHHTHCDVL